MDTSVDHRPAIRAVTALVHALQRSVLRERSIDPIPIEHRPGVVAAIERVLRELGPLESPTPQRRHLAEVAFQFHLLGEDSDGAGVVARALSDLGAAPARVSEMSRALELAQAGQHDEALAMLETEPQWLADRRRIELLRLMGRTTEALTVARRASETAQGLAPIEFDLAELLLHAGAVDEALTHANTACAEMPGRGQRLLLARCHFQKGDLQQARAQLGMVDATGSPSAIRLKAITEERHDWAAAARAWRDYLMLRPEEASARLRLARVLYQLGQVEEAADEAWVAVEHGSTPRIEDLVFCAHINHVARTPQRVERARSIASRLREGPPTAASESAYLHVWTRLGGPDDLPAPDFALLEKVGAAELVPIEALVEHVGQRAAAVQAIDGAYSRGLVSFESLCRLTGASTIGALFRMQVRGEPLQTRVHIGQAPFGIEGQHVLLGILELVLLAKHSALPYLHRAIGTTGKVLVFHDVHEQIGEEAGAVNLGAIDGQVNHARALLQNAHNYEVRRWGPHPSDRVYAEAEGVPYVAAPSENIEAAQSVDDLIQAARALGNATPDGGAPDAHLPERAFFTAEAFAALVAAHALEPDEALPTRIILGPQAIRTLEAPVQHAGLQQDLARAIRSVHEWCGLGIREGWLSLVSRPDVDLPPARGEQDEGLRTELARALSWREALVGEGNRRLLTADYLTGGFLGGVTPLELLLTLAWSREAYESLASRMRGIEDRCLSLGTFFQNHSDDDRPTLVRRLVGLGFFDAISKQDIANFAMLKGGLRQPAAAAMLNDVERATGTSSSPRTLAARAAVAELYAGATWLVVERASGIEPTLSSTVDNMLSRAESLGPDVLGGTLPTYLRNVVALTMTHPGLSLIRAEGSGYRVHPDAPTGQLWAEVARWAGTSATRIHVVQRALVWAITLADEISDSEPPTDLSTAPLLLAADLASRNEGPEAWSLAQDALGIISSNWPARPLRHLDFTFARGDTTEEFVMSGEEVLVRAAQAILETRQIRERGRHWEVHLHLGEVRRVVVRLPPEALLLRLDNTQVRAAVASFASWLGPRDGRLESMVMELGKTPDSSELRHRIARVAASAPWRLVCDDPTFVLQWGEMAGKGVAHPANLDDLREILSEPSALDSRPVAQVLSERFGENGAWASRTDRESLALQCVSVPGALPSMLVDLRMQLEKPREAFKLAASRLSDPEHHPAAVLAGDIYFMRAAMTSKHASRFGPAADLQRAYVKAIHTAIEKSLAGHAPGAWAKSEGEVLLRCSWVVERLALGQSVPISERLWLTYRLASWIAWVAGEAGLARLAASPIPARGMPRVQDVLDPARFAGDGFDFRLSTLLLAVSHAEFLVRKPGLKRTVQSTRPWSKELSELLVPVVSRALGDVEDELRDIDAASSPLGWPGPLASPPDLALNLLLEVDAKALAGLAPEARDRWADTLLSGRLDRAAPGVRRVLRPAIIATMLLNTNLSATARESLVVHVVRMHEDGVEPAMCVEWLLALRARGEAGAIEPLYAHIGVGHGTEQNALRRLLLATPPAELSAEVSRAIEKLSGRESLVKDAVEEVAREAVGQLKREAMRLMLALWPTDVPKQLEKQLQRARKTPRRGRRR